MSEIILPGSLVLYKNRPAVVRGVDKKINLELEDGESVQVRPKDAQVLHPGPLRSLADLRVLPKTAENAVESAWELLAGEQVTLLMLAELVYGVFSPATAWAAWEWVAAGEYFHGDHLAITVCTPQELEQKRQERQARAAEKQAWEDFVQSAREGRVSAEDGSTLPHRRSLEETVRLAQSQSRRSALLAALNMEETPENAHAFLLRTGVWDATVNPYPHRLNLLLSAPEGTLLNLPEEKRRDLTALPAYAIDDAGTVNPDDALSLDGERLWVHVADPAALIPPDSPLDLEARQRGETLHLPEGSIHMVPLEAIQRLGLGLVECSPALSFAIDFAENGGVAGVEIIPSWVRVTRRTYGSVEEEIDQEPFASLYRLAQRFLAYRNRAGAVSLELPEVKLWVVDGMVQISPLPRLRSRKLVQEAMLSAGAAAARFALHKNLAMPFSTNDSADLPYAGESLAGQFALRRYLRRSQYRVTPAPHALLGLEAYIQVTSPLRRCLDLTAHQQLRACLAGTAPILDSGAVLERIGAVEAALGAVRSAERSSELHWTLVYLLQHPGWQGQAVVVEKRDHRSLALIPELALEVELSLPIESHLDQMLPVRLLDVDLPRLRVSFGLMT